MNGPSVNSGQALRQAKGKRSKSIFGANEELGRFE